MRIAVFSETFLPGTDGVVTRLCATLDQLAHQDHEILLFAPEGAPPQYASARVIGVPSFRFYLYPEKRFAWPFPRVGRILREFQPDLIHSVNPGFLSFAAIYYSRRLRVPLIASYHTHIPAYARYYRLHWLEPMLWWCFRTIHNRAAINLCPSEATMAELRARGFRNLALWDRGVDLRRFSPDHRSLEMRRRLLGRPGADAKSVRDTRILLYVGRLAAEKGIERLRPCLDKMSNIHLAIVGDGPHRAALEQTFAGTNTTFTGYLFGDELAQAYASADGFVFPSTTETLGLVLYEAMASGLPIMAAESPATLEVLEHGRAGWLFNPLSPDSILATLTDLFTNQRRRQAVRKRAQELVSQLDWSGPTQQLIDYYYRLFHMQDPAG
ncbi:glycosyltransferase family 4 protein [Alicyclobacillus shizuokensis]|uniref:glycosyltransferase family 4 protein n=1 Tax=Alicyclobacillus shizuokensis TaxID=392014 RepID=UPI00082D982E|nr:glycosyltransferase family 1 protein [Alicyclobacillus shizuokensis]